MSILERLNEYLGDVEQNHSLRQETRIGTGGVAEFYYQAKDLQELIKATGAAIVCEASYLVIGSGSNILFSDFGFKGLVIKNESKNISFLAESSQVIVDSGVSLSALALEASARDLAGLEPFINVPGTVGAAVANNVTAFTNRIGGLVKSATILFPKDKEFQILKKNNDWLDFGNYSSKITQMAAPKPVILSLKLQLAHNKKEDILKRLACYQKMSKKFFPLADKCLMVFKEEIAESRKVQELIKSLDKFKIRRGTVGLSKVDLNFIKNQGKATSEEIRSMIENLKLAVREKTGINLNENIEFFGNWQSIDMEEIDEEARSV